jgi:hypothetical protein
MLVFERDLAAAMGSWDRWIKAESRKVFGDAEDGLRSLYEKLKK